ncbi:rod shape-determining protein RodA [Lysinibacillus sp. 2017]|nr:MULTISPECIES: FtsW/RodA/SpoVE family cell cycle protein [unclassified Lysinibacillus]AWE09247.1 rod shape-determining protein RodA [Lysinibacillus sp. 2017]TGN34704.1 rod shape-determining protein RodA [Lysinibacillus sp. S2017]
MEKIDWTLISILFIFFCISLLAISSAQTTSYTGINFIPRQIVYYGILAFIILCVMYFDIEQYKKITWFLYGFGILLLVALIFMPEGKGQIGEVVNGAKSWYHTPLGNIQPSEFMKTFYILACAKTIGLHNEKHLRTLKTDLYLLIKILGLLIVPFLLVFDQPDLGSALVFIAITIALILVSGISWLIILPLLTLATATSGFVIWMVFNMQDFLENMFGIEPYKLGRIFSWFDPYKYASNEGFQLISSMNSIGSGEIFGKGYLNREVYVVENHTDFIFTVIGEKWGFIGASFIICMYFILMYHLIKIAMMVKDPYSSYICTGIIAMITFHVFENIGMTIQLLPITGIPLPFISYGGSSLMGNALAIGLIFSMHFHHKHYMFTTIGEDDED